MRVCLRERMRKKERERKTVLSFFKSEMREKSCMRVCVCVCGVIRKRRVKKED